MEVIKNLETAIEALIQSFREKQECDFERETKIYIADEQR